MLNTQIMSLPAVMAKYQFFFYDLLSNISKQHNILEEVYYNSILSYKESQHQLSNFDFNASELQKMIKASPDYRSAHLNLMDYENKLKMVEEMMSNIKSIGYAINNKITLTKIDNGIV